MSATFMSLPHNPPSQPNADPQVAGCVANIGPRERQKRMTFGLLTLVVGFAAAVAVIALGLDRWWRLGLFLPFAGGAVGIFQALDKT